MNTSLLMEIRSVKDETLLKFSYNPSKLSYAAQNQFYSVQFLQSNRNVQEFLRNGKMSIAGEGVFLSNPSQQNEESVGVINSESAIGQWHKFIEMFQMKRKKSPYFHLYNPVLGDTRTVVFTAFSSSASQQAHSITFSFTAVETDVISDEENLARFTAYNENNAKYTTPARVKEIQENIDEYISLGYDYDDALAWGLKGKVAGSSDYQVIEAYITRLKEFDTNENASDEYYEKIDKILKNNARLIKLAEEKTNILEGTTESKNTNAYSDYIVKSGDTLSTIAMRFYGDGSREKWLSIYNENRDIIEEVAISKGRKSSSNGRWIYSGTKIKISNVIQDKPVRIINASDSSLFNFSDYQNIDINDYSIPSIPPVGILSAPSAILSSLDAAKNYINTKDLVESGSKENLYSNKFFVIPGQ